MGEPRPKKAPARRPRSTGASTTPARRAASRAPRVAETRSTTAAETRSPRETPPTEIRSPREAPPAKGTEDIVLVHGKTEDGALKILRKKGDELSAGELRPVEEGKPLRGNLLRLRPREDLPFVADVEEEIDLSSATPMTSTGPAKVATTSYRKGWDGIWGKRKRTDPTLN
ncbi:MAG: hypothetical protein KF901_06600 [Myxococcales bacterium]|nr:hypothetical protein [Myxococcales bacterium]